MRNFLAGILFTMLVIILGALFVLWRGYIEFRADMPASWMEKNLVMAAVDASTDRHAPDAKNPIPATDENVLAGAKIYRNHCVGCHGDPAHPDSTFGAAFYPPVPQFFREAPDMPENQNFYIIQHGISWTGMAGWKGVLNEREIWQVVTFLSHIKKLPPAAEQELRKPFVPAP